VKPVDIERQEGQARSRAELGLHEAHPLVVGVPLRFVDGLPYPASQIVVALETALDEQGMDVLAAGTAEAAIGAANRRAAMLTNDRLRSRGSIRVESTAVSGF
jgi:hypothetical protein